MLWRWSCCSLRRFIPMRMAPTWWIDDKTISQGKAWSVQVQNGLVRDFMWVGRGGIIRSLTLVAELGWLRTIFFKKKERGAKRVFGVLLVLQKEKRRVGERIGFHAFLGLMIGKWNEHQICWNLSMLVLISYQEQHFDQFIVKILFQFGYSGPLDLSFYWFCWNLGWSCLLQQTLVLTREEKFSDVSY